MIDILILASALFATQDAVTSAPALPLPDTRRECRVIGETGSRLARRRICATRAEWIERDRLDRQRVAESQSRQVAPTYDDLLRNSPGRPTTPRCGRC
jgi:hypothetical protein